MLVNFPWPVAAKSYLKIENLNMSKSISFVFLKVIFLSAVYSDLAIPKNLIPPIPIVINQPENQNEINRCVNMNDCSFFSDSWYFYNNNLFGKSVRPFGINLQIGRFNKCYAENCTGGSIFIGGNSDLAAVKLNKNLTSNSKYILKFNAFSVGSLPPAILSIKLNGSSNYEICGDLKIDFLFHNGKLHENTIVCEIKTLANESINEISFFLRNIYQAITIEDVYMEQIIE